MDEKVHVHSPVFFFCSAAAGAPLKKRRRENQPHFWRKSRNDLEKKKWEPKKREERRQTFINNSESISGIVVKISSILPSTKYLQKSCTLGSKNHTQEPPFPRSTKLVLLPVKDFIAADIYRFKYI